MFLLRENFLTITKQQHNISHFSALLFLRSKHTKRLQIPTPFERAPIIMHSKVQQIAAPKDDDRSTTAGRTVTVGNNAMAGYRRLWTILNSNKIRQEVKRNRYYEKPFLKRQRVRFDFGQKKFKDVIRKKVQLVLQMKARYV
jgi:small subunit ribosomal protein S21